MTEINLKDMTVGEITRFISSGEYDANTIALLCSDGRERVRKIGQRLKKQALEKSCALDKFRSMMRFENEERKKGFSVIAGIDEAGVGPLAGPVVAAAVILDLENPVPGINDSKKLSESKRKTLYEIIMEQAVSYSTGIVEPEEIDRINILQASLKAMSAALDTLSIKPDIALIDARTLNRCDIPQKAIIKGDSLSVSIAAASILAKVTRDRIMEGYAEMYPEYGFDKHKGYPSEEHRKAIEEYGPCPIHRKSFTLLRGKT